MRTRLISAAVGIPIVVLALWGGVWGVGILGVLSGVLAGRELGLMAAGAAGPMAAIARSSIRRLSNVTTWPVLAITIAIVLDMDLWSPFLIGIGLLTAAFAAWASVGRGARFAVAALYFGLALAHGPLLTTLSDSTAWLTVAIFGTFAVDTSAFIVGLSVGRRRMAPSISPRKTWEGAAGGLLGGVGAVIGLAAAFDLGLPVWQAGGVGLAVAFVGMSGDLYESWLKRSAGVKDSGGLIPGHGGILDRIDSLAPNLVTVYWLAIWSGA